MRKAQGRARLVYNPGAGRAGGLTVDDLLRALADAGFTPVHDPTATEADLDRLLENPVDLVVAAGGDGTVRAVATRLIGRDIPLAIVPLGTANNVAAALGV
ncbi:MAG: diacylglycerol/lipid kinase family protein, partial [bacterium]